MADRNGMYGHKTLSLWFIHFGLMFVVIGSIVSWLTMVSDRVFLAPFTDDVYLYDLQLKNNCGTLIVNERSVNVKPFHSAEFDGWEFYLLKELPNGTLAIEMRRDQMGKPLVFTGYFIFAVGCCGLMGMRWLMAVLALICAMPLFKPSSPALQSPWFSIHVGLIAAAYMCFLILPWKCSRKLLAYGVCLLGLGIATGSVWASSAWGRYWGWDPKETFALGLMLIYCIPLHFQKYNRPWFYISALAGVVVMLFLPGLHSYI